MQLGELLSHLPSVHRPKFVEDDIKEICTDSHKARAGALFVALRGAQCDGHTYVHAAYLCGCRAFLCEYPVSLPPDAQVAYVPDCRHALAILAAVFYGHPTHGLTLIGITGTKGKTTTALILHRLLSSVGVSVGYIGSNGVKYANRTEQIQNTTPSPLVLQRIFADMRAVGVRVAVVEVSSQAISCERIAGLSFPICIFTNLASDHIGEGEHPDFSHYRETKARLFADYGCRYMIANADDETSPYMLAGSSATHLSTVSLGGREAALCASHIRAVRTEEGYGSSFYLSGEDETGLPVFLSLPGECNVTNSLLALAAARAYFSYAQLAPAPSLRTLAAALADVRIAGRFELVKTALQGVDFVIDYAHNGYSMQAAIKALRAYAPKRILCLFGSVGGRTYSRRAELAIAATDADFCIVTSDNPDTELPEDTMRELCEVLESHSADYVAIPDRADAIRYAVLCTEEGDCVLLAGKGHEGYQLINGKRIPFSEKEILRAAVEERTGGSRTHFSFFAI